METVERPRKSLEPAAIVTFRDPKDDSAIAEKLNVRIKLEPPRLQTKPVVDSKRTQVQRQAPRLMRTWPRAPVSTWCQSHKSVPTFMHFDRAALVSADKPPLQADSSVYNDSSLSLIWYVVVWRKMSSEESSQWAPLCTTLKSAGLHETESLQCKGSAAPTDVQMQQSFYTIQNGMIRCQEPRFGAPGTQRRNGRCGKHWLCTANHRIDRYPMSTLGEDRLGSFRLRANSMDAAQLLSVVTEQQNPASSQCVYSSS